MKPIRAFIPLAFVLLVAACGGQDDTTPPSEPPSGPDVPDTPYVPPAPVTDVPNSPYVGDWAWSTTLDGEELFTQGVLSVHSFDSTGRGTGSYAVCYESCPVKPEGDGSLTVSEEFDSVDIGLYDEFEGEFYSKFFGYSISGMQKDEQGRNAFAGTGFYEICVTTCTEADVSFVAVQTSNVSTYPPFE